MAHSDSSVVIHSYERHAGIRLRVLTIRARWDV